jgi:hypothetical protein
MSIQSAGSRWSRAGLALFLVLAAAPRARAAGVDPLRLGDMGQKALKLYDDLDFNRAKATLEQALAEAKTGGLDQSPIAARLRLYLGLVLAAGLQQPDAATAQFKLAAKIDPTITPPDGLFNPEVAALFAAARAPAPANAPAGAAEAASNESTPPAGAREAASNDTNGSPASDAEAGAGDEETPRPPSRPRRKPAPRVADAEDSDEDVEDRASESEVIDRYFVALGLGAGGGTSAGHIDMKGVTPNTAPGGFAMSELGHVTMTAGYFWSPEWLFALEARLQLVSGPTLHCTGATCSDPSGSAVAVLAKATHFTGDGPFKIFGTAGIGGGSIRQIVKLNGLPDCGRTGNQQCFDTVTGGPVLLAAGGGASYALGRVLLLGGLTANVAFPDFMLNIDLTLGAGVRF